MKSIFLVTGLALLTTAPARADKPIVVTSAAELEAAMSPANAGRTIRVRAGDYEIQHTLVVPDGATVRGEGDMGTGGAGLASGWKPGAVTTLRAAASLAGDLISLGDGSKLRGLRVIDVVRPGGNVVAVVSRAAFDSIDAEIAECELVNPNGSGVQVNGPAGRTVVVLSRTIRSVSPPVTHEGSSVEVRITRSILRSPGNGSGIFAINFAPRSRVGVTVRDSVIGGGLDTNGGVSRPLEVTGSSTEIDSRGNLYRSDGEAGPAPLGWAMKGSSGPPIGLLVPSTHHNSLRMESDHDRIEGFMVGIYADGGTRFFPDPPAGPTSHNRLELDVAHLRLSTLFVDLWLFGAESGESDLSPGDDNVLTVRFRDVTGSGARDNFYSHAVGPFDHLDPAFAGSGNRLIIKGSAADFARRNPGFDPAPGPEFFERP